ncbi:MAG: AmmeMemoRadiSam system protein B [Elusimicrobiales bacterium]|nr:AmmeMemoRadiSam system protein B [Elusimicrobiales bacterium]
MTKLTESLFLTALLLGAARPAGAREAAVAGKFYPADPAGLARLVDGYLAPGGQKKPEGGVVAVLAPHAGYEFSGRLAGMAYWFAADSYETVVILATGHTEAVKGAALLASDFYETPLGRVQPDRQLAAALLKASPLFEDRPSAHLREHAVEVQLPFLQRKLKKPFKLLAATLNTDDPAARREIGTALAAALKGKKALIVISADFSHYPGEADAAASDGALRLALEAMDPDLFRTAAAFMAEKGVPGLETCACGGAAVEAGLTAARLLGAKSFRTLAVSDSGAESPRAGTDSVVGYISGLFLKAGRPLALALAAGQKDRLLKEARSALERSFSGERQPAGLAADPRLNLPGAAFVTLTKGGALRGCVGTVVPALTLADAVRYGALGAAFRDARFPPLGKEELPEVEIEISVLSPLRPAQPGGIKPRAQGVLLERGDKSGIFLPQVWEQIPGKDEFMGELCAQKAGLPRDCWKDPDTKIYSFTVDSFTERHSPPASAPSAAAADK